MDEQFSTLEFIKSEESMYNPVRDMLEPPNPIITKNVDNIDEKANFKIDPLAQITQQAEGKHSHHSHQHRHSSKEYEQAKKKESVKFKPYMEVMTLTNGYEKDSLIFKRYLNDSFNKRGRNKFFSSLFVGIQGNRGLKLPEYRGMMCDDDLIFDSNFETANLMAVYKIEDRVYDLVLQNDLNTKGFTQWYNFKVHNKRNNFIAKFNIVNLYKSKSLYNLGMKPIVRSEKSDKNVKRTWRRKGYNIYYEKNDLSYEDNNNKCYKTLTFQYDFTIENDTVQFAHGMPYDLTDLHFLLNSIKNNPKVKITPIGSTVMGRPIQMIKISGDATNKMEKKALVILGRQHPGETPGSYIAEEMILELLRNSNEVDFLHWRFDIFIIPMVNMDGVFLGNYRSNFAGFDLNRCWLHPDPIKHPEVIAIKNQIKKIQKRYKIELILDLHGHSRKMGSFFYGNNYGSNFMLFPFIASKANRNILFEQSKFSHETDLDVKGSTARVVLGNLLKQTGGYVYTYQVSFYGNYKEDHTPFSFQEDHYKDLGKALVLSIYRTYLEMYKEEKTLKESHYLKGVKTEIHDVALKRHIEDEDESGSDSEAEEQMKQQEQEIDQFFEDLKNAQQFSPPPIVLMKRPSAYEGIDRQISISKIRDLRQLGQPVEKYDEQMKQKIYNLLQKNNDQLKEVIMQRLPSIRKDQRQSTLANLKKEISIKNDITLGDMQFDKDIESMEISKGKKRNNVVDYFRVKKFKNYADWLKIHGQTFVLQERQKQKHGCTERTIHPHQSKDGKTLQHIKQNLILINNISKSVDKNPSLPKKVNTINLMENTFQKAYEEKEMDYHQKRMNVIKNRTNNSGMSKQFPNSIASEEVNIGSIRVNRLDQQRQQNKVRQMSSTPNKDMKGKGKLPPI